MCKCHVIYEPDTQNVCHPVKYFNPKCEACIAPEDIFREFAAIADKLNLTQLVDYDNVG